jgi:hypothetical protein
MSNCPCNIHTKPFIHCNLSESVKYVRSTINLPFLLVSCPLNLNSSLLCTSSSGVNTPCQCEIITPFSCMKDGPEPDTFPLGKGSIPLISPTQLLSLLTILLTLSSFTTLLPVGVSISSKSFLPIETFSVYHTALSQVVHLYYSYSLVRNLAHLDPNKQ